MKNQLHRNCSDHRSALVALVLLALTLTFISPEQGFSAPRPPAFATANGDFNTVISDVYTELGTSGGDTYYREDLVFLYGGDLTGTATDVNYMVIHADGSFDSYATEVCTSCTLGGRTGNFTATYVIHGADFENYTGYLAFTGGTGGLSGLRGFGTFGRANFNNTYSYQYRFVR